jgi:hypothetical protein
VSLLLPSTTNVEVKLDTVSDEPFYVKENSLVVIVLNKLSYELRFPAASYSRHHDPLGPRFYPPVLVKQSFHYEFHWRLSLHIIRS